MIDALRLSQPSPKLAILAFCIIVASLVEGCRSAGDRVSPVYKRVSTLQGLSDVGEPFGLALAGDVIYVSDGASGTIRAIEPGAPPRVFATGLRTPSAVAFLPDGDLAVADTGSHTIRRVARDGSTSVIAGIDGVSGDDDGAAAMATFNAPVGLAVTGDGVIFVSDTYNDRIRAIHEGFVTTIAGGEQGFADGVGPAAGFDTPLGLALWGEKLLVADSGNRRLRVVEQNGAVWTLAGTGSQQVADGLLASATFVNPVAVTVDDRGQIFVADGNAIRVIGRRAFPFVETLVGDHRGFADGGPNIARFNRPSGLAVGRNGDVYVADSDNRFVRVISDRDAERVPAHLQMVDPGLPLAQTWPYDPPENLREIAGTMGEIRGEIGPENKPVWFHNGLDVAGAYGEAAKFIRSETVLDPHSAENFGTARELLRLPVIGYIHLRLGRDRTDSTFGDRRFQFQRDASGKLSGLRVPRGTHFAAGDTIGTLNSQNHVHLIAGRPGREINALAALSLPSLSDSISPTIEKVSLFTQDWREIETGSGDNRIRLTDRTRIVARAYDRMDGNSERRRLGVYKVGYQLVPQGAEGGPINWTIIFDRMPSNDAIRFAYAPGSKSGYTSETVFNYIASNRLSGDHFAEEFLDPALLAGGRYVLRIFAADFFGNTASKEISIEVEK